MKMCDTPAPIVAPACRTVRHLSRSLSDDEPQITGFSSVPSLAIATETWSPAWRNLGGVNPIPTPTGVPVAMLPPGFELATIYAAAIATRAENAQSATEFVARLTSAANVQLRRSAGFSV